MKIHIDLKGQLLFCRVIFGFSVVFWIGTRLSFAEIYLPIFKVHIVQKVSDVLLVIALFVFLPRAVWCMEKMGKLEGALGFSNSGKRLTDHTDAKS